MREAHPGLRLCWACLQLNKVNAPSDLEPPGKLLGDGLLPVSLLRVRKLRRTVRSYAEGLEAENKASTGKRSARLRMWFVTLTYRDATPWKPTDVREYLQRVRVWAKRKGFRLRYVWVAEMHEKRFERTGLAKPHYHLLLWIPAALSLPLSDKRGWWKHGHTSTERARTVGYLVKYTSKAHHGDGLAYPEGMRIYGVGGMEGDGLNFHRHAMKPAWMRERIPCGEKWKRTEGGILRQQTGEWWQCPYSVLVKHDQGQWKLAVSKIPEERLLFVRADGENNWKVEKEFTFAAQIWIRQAKWEAARAEEKQDFWASAIACADDCQN